MDPSCSYLRLKSADQVEKTERRRRRRRSSRGEKDEVMKMFLPSTQICHMFLKPAAAGGCRERDESSVYNMSNTNRPQSSQV